MLKIVNSRFSSSARGAFIDEISRLAGECKPACLIVPEQQTVMAEALMTHVLPPSSVLTFEVTNFTRLANTTFRTLGGLSGEYCDSEKKALIMWRTLTELSPTLALTSGRREISAGLVESMLSAVGQMQNLGIHPTDLAEAAANDNLRSDGRLSAKLSDLAAIFALYKELLGQRYADTGDDAEAMIKKLEDNPAFLSDTALFIEGFSSFTAPQYKLIALLAARTSVNVALTLPKGKEGAFEYSEIAECQRRLISTARKQGADIKLQREEGYRGKRNEPLDEISALLWSTNRPNDNITLQNSGDLRIFEATTPYDECAFVCEDIRRRVMAGASYSDFAIVARSAENYQGILDGALFDAKIPAFTSYRRDINEFEAIKLIYTAYAAAHGFKREDIISYAKCALSGIGRSECDEFEMYVNMWQINGRRFTDGEVWNMNPLGYTTRRADGTDEKLIRINDVRERIVKPLISLANRIEKATTVRGQAEVLLDFLLEIEMESSLKKRADVLEKMGETSLSEENSALWRIICNSLDTLVSVLGDAPCDSEAFLSQLKVVFSATDIGRIPSFVDQVTVGSADMLRLYEKKHIYLIGVNAGQFPQNVTDNSYFSDRDRKRLNECGLEITPELEIKGARELYIFSRAFSYATDSVTISFSSADTRFKAIEPGEVIGRITLLTGGAVRPVKIEELSALSLVYTPELALTRMGQLGDDYSTVRDALIESGYEREISVSEGDISNSTARMGRNLLANSRPLSLSQTKIDSYVSCPFGYYCKHLIKLQEDGRAEFDARSIGSFIHAILENFFAALSRQGRKSGDLSADEIGSLTRQAAEKYIAELGEDVINASVKTRIKIDRLCRAALPVVEGLCEEFSQSAFEPRFFEMSLGYDDSTPDPISITAESGRVTIYGIVDRVDAYKKGEDVYIRVIDYKTGQKEFSPEDIKEGSNLQMFLYLKALVESDKQKYRESLGVGEGGKILPAGVIYVKTSIKDVRVDRPDDAIADEAVKNAQAREGMLLDDPEVISAMTLKYTPLYNRRTPDKIPEAKRNLLYDSDGWQQIMSDVEGAVCRVADGIRSGIMDAEPKERSGRSPCEYCPFKPICRRG